MSNDNTKAAFACANHVRHQPGLTKREYFAAAALTGLLANQDVTQESESGTKLVCLAFSFADKMVTQL